MTPSSRILRRPLEVAFKKEVGRTINHEIIRTRIDKAMHLLRHSDESVWRIASASGFQRVNHFHRVF